MRALTLAAALFALSPLAVPGVASAQTQAIASPQQLALGHDLAKLNNDEVSADNQISAMLVSVAKMFAENEDMRALEKEHPGVIKMMLDAMAPPIREQTLRTLPKLWDRLGALYAANMSEQELRDAIAFYSGPVGVRLRAAMVGNLDVKAMLSEVMADPEKDISEKALGASLGSTALGAARALSPEDQKALAQFAFTPAGAQIQRLNSQVIKAVSDWSREASPELDAKLEKITEDLVTRILEKEQSK